MELELDVELELGPSGPACPGPGSPSRSAESVKACGRGRDALAAAAAATAANSASVCGGSAGPSRMCWANKIGKVKGSNEPGCNAQWSCLRSYCFAALHHMYNW